MIRISSVFLIALVITGAYAGELDCNIRQERDRFQPGTTIYVGSPIVIWGTIFSKEYSYLQLRCVIWDDMASGFYFWQVYYAGEDWKFITGIKLLLDGKVVEVNDPMPARKIGESAVVFEGVSCEITARTYQSINRAKSVSLRVVASQASDDMDHDFNSAELDCIRTFWAQTRKKSP